MRLAIITTHPIQYYAPVFKLLHQHGRIQIKVFYTWGEKAIHNYDPGFNTNIRWDLPLLSGYPYEWAENISPDPGSHRFKGIVTPGLIRQIEAWQPDAVLIYGWAYHSHLKILRYFKNRIPVFFRGDSTLLDPSGKLKKYARALFLTWIYTHVDVVLYTGTNSKAYFKNYGLKETQQIFAPHAIDNKRFAAERNREVQELKMKLGITQKDILILFAGKFDKKKDPLLLLDAFLQLRKKDVHLLFVGNGALEQMLKQKASHEPCVHFMDFENQSYMPVIYQACDLFCLPSSGPGETWGLAVNEAMACSKAILVSDKVGCAADLVKNEYNGAVFKAQSLTSLCEQLNILLHQGKDGLKYMGFNSGEMINNWTFEIQAGAIESAILKYE
jgi:glycosyltransferase involved in cell wall biosynthesis